ncbi:MAG TPA: 2-hydroxyacid dehydrogenase [candidate division Zixibacteria bacterium]|nr:2-hydroxyacid dehydrogenase [candidate division Zixibacteria bacterium]
MKILVTNSYFVDLLKQQGNLLADRIEFVVPKESSDEELAQLAHDVEIIVATRLAPEVVQSAKKLKFIQKTGAGVDAMPFNVIPENVLMANTSGANPVPMAEGAIALLISLAKRITQRHNLFPDRSSERGTELRGKKVGIIGLGSIGIEIAKRLQAFEMSILGIKRQPTKNLKQQLQLEFLGGPDDLDYVLKESDFVIVTVPLTPVTRGMISKKELSLMKETAFIINIARAGIIDEEALYNAIKENKIAGAGLDVWWVPHWWDPKWKPELDKPSHFPIWELPNVIATPHNVGFTERTIYSEKTIQIIVENINLVIKGRQPKNLVDKENQY